MLKAEALRLGQPDPWGYLSSPQQKTGCVVSVLRIMFLEFSTALMPSLRLLCLWPHPHVDNTYRVSSFSLLSRKTRLSSFPLEGRGDQLRGGPVRSHNYLLWKPGQDPLCVKRFFRVIPSRLQSCPGLGSWTSLASRSLTHQGPHAASSWLALGLELCLCLQVLKAELMICCFRPRGTGRPSRETPQRAIAALRAMTMW